ncbi:MAG: hypothetical protein ACXITV_05900 [Luteibaculaceae bacterium]
MQTGIFKIALLGFALITMQKSLLGQEIPVERNETFRKTYHFISKEIYLDNPEIPIEKRYNYLGPVVGYNAANGTLLGLYFGNVASKNDRWQYNTFTLYGFKTQNINGFWNFRYKFKDDNNTQKRPELFFNAARFEASNLNQFRLRYNTLQGGLEFKNVGFSKFEGTLRLSATGILEEEKVQENRSDNFSLFTHLNYQLKRSFTGQNWYINPEVIQGPDFAKVSLSSTLQFFYNTNFGSKPREKQILLRGFAGKFLYNNTNNGRFNWQMSGQNGRTDFMYNQAFLGRYVEQRNLLNRQFIDNHGSFKTPIRGGTSNDWLTALNAKIDLPIPLPIGVFGNAGWYPFTQISIRNGVTDITQEIGNLSEAGLYLSLFKNALVIYLPLLYSTAIQNELTLQGNSTLQNITFSLNINQLLPIKH